MPGYQFNSFTGRLKESSHLQPLFPISAHPLNKDVSLNVIWDTIKTKPVKTSVASTAGSTLEPEFIEKLKIFQKDVEKPIYLMGGPKDKIIFGITCAVVILGVAQCFRSAYMMAFPKK